MKSRKLEKLASNVVNHSLNVQKGSRILIDVTGNVGSFTDVLIEKVQSAGGIPFLRTLSSNHVRSIIKHCTQEQMNLWLRQELYRIKSMDGYIGVRAESNSHDSSDISDAQYNKFLNYFLNPYQKHVSSLKNWVLMFFPTSGAAQAAQMSLDRLTNIYFKSCNVNYNELKKRTEPLQERLTHTNIVRITGLYTDLYFSIKNMPSMICVGQHNLPDGEIFTCPQIDSIEGNIRFNVKVNYMGIELEDVELMFKSGRIVKANCNKPEVLHNILSTDQGASRIGEFGIGLNPYIQQSFNNMLFDEKMSGSIHLGLGQAYPMVDNGNRSSVHWDLTLSQFSEHGGGNLYFDDVLIRRNGLFVKEDLIPLNYFGSVEKIVD